MKNNSPVKTLILKRLIKGKTETVGALFLDAVFLCFTLEDEIRNGEKVYGESAIPAGTYSLGLRKDGSLHTQYATKFKFHKGMIEILGIPGFSRVYFHIGNRESETLGCPLLGYNAVKTNIGTYEIARSTDAYVDFYNLIIKDVEKNNIRLIIQDTL